MPFITHRIVERSTELGINSGTMYVRMSGNINPELHPVIIGHGWPQSDTADNTLVANKAAALNALLGSGFVIYSPFTGSNWSHPTASSPSVGGSGINGFTHMVEQAELDLLCDASKVHLFGGSMGGANVMMWAKENPTLISGVYLMSPLCNFGSTWDQAIAVNVDIQTSMKAVWGGTTRATFLAAATTGNPADNVSGIANAIGGKTKALLLSTDEIIPFEVAFAFLQECNVSVDVTTGTHFFGGIVNWSEYIMPAWFREMQNL